jgi:NAD(P)-dependent dehydrogenase (short-subunit alcohol dehydrogenase family)
VSGGLGAALFVRLAARGDRILAIGRRFTADQRALAGDEPTRVRLHTADLADIGDPSVARTLRGDLDAVLADATEIVLINNAATIAPIGAITGLAPAAVAAAVTVNLTAPMVLTTAFLAARPSGVDTRILYISSGAAHRVVDGWSVYSATKRGAEMFFDAVAVQVPDAYVVNVNPGVMDTPMQAVLRSATFDERDRYVGLYERGELRDPDLVAGQIVADHLTKPITHE